MRLMSRVPPAGELSVTTSPRCGSPKWQQHDVSQRQFEVVGQPVDEHDVALQQRGPHRPGRDGVPVGHGGAQQREAEQEEEEAAVGP